MFARLRRAVGGKPAASTEPAASVSSAGAPPATGVPPPLVIPAPPPASDAGSSGSSPRSGVVRERSALTPRTGERVDDAVDFIILDTDINGDGGEVEIVSAPEGDLSTANAKVLVAMGIDNDAAFALAHAVAAATTWPKGADERGAGYNADDLRSLCYASGEKPFPAIFGLIGDEPVTIFLLIDHDSVLKRALAEEAARLKMSVQELRKVYVAHVPRAAGGDAEADVGKGGSQSDAGFSLGVGVDGVVGFAAGKDAAHFTSTEARDLAQRLRANGRPRLAEAIERALNLSVRMTDLIVSVVGSTAPTLRAANFTGELVDVTVKTFGDSGAWSLVLVAHTPVKIRIGVAHYVYKFSGQRHWSCVLALLFAAYFSVFALNPTFSSDGKGVVQLTRMLVPRALGQASAAAKGIWRIDVATGERRIIDGSPGMTIADLIRMGKISAGDILLVASGKVKLVYVAAAERGEAAAVAEREGRVGSV